MARPVPSHTFFERRSFLKVLSPELLLRAEWSRVMSHSHIAKSHLTLTDGHDVRLPPSLLSPAVS